MPNANNPFTFIGGIAVDGNRALVLQHDTRSVLAVDLFTNPGNRTVYSGPAFPSATDAFEQPRAIALDQPTLARWSRIPARVRLSR